MSTALLEKESVTAESYRTPMQVTKLRKYRSTSYYICPRCGQCLSWKNYRKAVVIEK